jgi:hypothetical protein
MLLPAKGGFKEPALIEGTYEIQGALQGTQWRSECLDRSEGCLPSLNTNTHT